MRIGPALFTAMAAAALACSGGEPKPATLDPRNDICAHCRMHVSDGRFAAQLAARGEEPLFFDDVGCLRDHLAQGGRVPRGAVAFVADHRTRDWVAAARAVYTRVPGLTTPMSTELIAHADRASRDADPDAAGGAEVPPAELFRGGPLPGGKP